MAKKTETTTTEDHTEVLNLLKGLSPIQKQCPTHEGRMTMWLPTFSEKGIEIPDPRGEYQGRQDSEGHPANVFYQCDYSGSATCRYCISRKADADPKEDSN